MLGGGIITPNIQERKNGNMKRKGFTLVELLIVIVVIGILSAMMMLSSTEAVTSARANNIVSNMRNLKTAALEYYVDNLNYLEATTRTDNGLDMADGDGGARKGIYRYLNGSSGTATNNQVTVNGYTYTITAIKRDSGVETLAGAKWYLTCEVPDIKVREKLKARAESVGILGATTGKPTETTYTTTSSNKVYYLVR